MKTLKEWLNEPDPPRPPVSSLMVKRVLLINTLCWLFVLAAAVIERNGALLALAIIPISPAIGLYFDIVQFGIKETRPKAGGEQVGCAEDDGHGGQ